MNILLRNYKRVIVVFRSFHKHFRQELELIDIPRNIFQMSRAQVIHMHTNKPESIQSTGSICNLLRKGGNWDNLSAGLKSIKLTNTLVDDILLDLKEPSDAKRALVFFHWCSHHREYQHGIRSYCMMVQILVRAGLLVDARALLESVIVKNSESEASGFTVVETLLSTYDAVLSSPRVFDLLVQIYSNLRMFQMAFKACCYLEEHGFLSSLISFNTLLHVVQKSDQNDLVWKIYEHMVVKRIYPNQVTVEIMIGALCKEGALQNIVDILDRIHGKRCSPVIIVNTALTSRMLEENRAEAGVVLLKRMLQKNMILDNVAYSLIIYAQCKMANLELAHDSYENMLKRGHGMNSFVCTSFIGLQCKAGKIEDANRLMDDMLLAGLKPYAETYNLLIEWCSRLGRLEESLAYYDEMLKKGFLPSCIACNEMIGKLCEASNVEKANNILTVLLDKGFIPNEVTYSNLIDGYGRMGNFQEVLKLYNEMQWRGPSPGMVAYTSVIRSLCRCGKFREAEKVLTLMEHKSLTPSREIYDELNVEVLQKG